MNPLEMPGPDFLRFYLIYGLGVLGVCWLVRAALHTTGPSLSMARWTPGVYPREGDAYPIALLRGGPREVTRTVLGRLFSTGLIALDGATLRRAAPEEPVALAALESAVLATLADGVSATRAESLAQTAAAPHLEPMQEDLERQGLIPSPLQAHRFDLLRAAGLALVPSLGFFKLLKAVHEGRSNTGILVLMLIAYGFGTVALLRPPRRTPAGNRYLDWLKESHQGLVSLLTSGRRESHGELALVASIYGLQALPVLSPLRTALQPPSSDTGSGCGSSGSGCGGGGCGGGCGGCGG
jgi:uncharacterized protein (TIGR04222 family)